MSIIDSIQSSRLICGDETHAFRDPAVIHRDGVFHLYCTYVETEADGEIYMYTVHMRSEDLIHWSEPQKLTPRDKALNYSSPGNIVELDGKYILCLQTYPRENGEKYGNQNARLFTMASENLIHWDEPRLIRVKGEVPFEDMGRMIDPYLIFDPKTKLWNCFFKQNGVSRSVSADMEHWEFRGHMGGGENASVIAKDGGYYLFHSPDNGIGVKYSEDLAHWRDVGETLTLGQQDWIWARGRLTAGFVLPYEEEGETLYLMFFHGSGPRDESEDFDKNASIGLAWSRDLVRWEWR